MNGKVSKRHKCDDACAHAYGNVWECKCCCGRVNHGKLGFKPEGGT